MVFSATFHDFIPLGQHDHDDEQKESYAHFRRPCGTPVQTSWPVLGIAWIVSMTIVALLSFHMGGSSMEVQAKKEPSLFPLMNIYKSLDFEPTRYGLRRNNTLYPEPLGRNILILDVDSRGWDAGAALEKDEDGLSRARLNHYLYAQMHNYTYRFVQPKPYASRHNTWVKVDEIYRALRTRAFQFVVFTDSDVFFTHLNMPLEALLDYWNIDSTIALAGALDPGIDRANFDMHDRQLINTGFLITQNTPRTDQMFEDWITCPTDEKYAACSRWKDSYFHEQSAFSEYVRYDYADVVKELPCEEANSAPGQEPKGCSGKYVRHYWHGKEMLKQAADENVSAMVLKEAHDSLMLEWESGVFFNYSSETNDTGRTHLYHDDPRW